MTFVGLHKLLEFQAPLDREDLLFILFFIFLYDVIDMLYQYRTNCNCVRTIFSSVKHRDLACSDPGMILKNPKCLLTMEWRLTDACYWYVSAQSVEFCFTCTMYPLMSS